MAEDEDRASRIEFLVGRKAELESEFQAIAPNGIAPPSQHDRAMDIRLQLMEIQPELDTLGFQQNLSDGQTLSEALVNNSETRSTSASATSDQSHQAYQIIDGIPVFQVMEGSPVVKGEDARRFASLCYKADKFHPTLTEAERYRIAVIDFSAEKEIDLTVHRSNTLMEMRKVREFSFQTSMSLRSEFGGQGGSDVPSASDFRKATADMGFLPAQRDLAESHRLYAENVSTMKAELYAFADNLDAKGVDFSPNPDGPHDPSLNPSSGVPSASKISDEKARVRGKNEKISAQEAKSQDEDEAQAVEQGQDVDESKGQKL